jgi:hypothetical protein
MYQCSKDFLGKDFLCRLKERQKLMTSLRDEIIANRAPSFFFYYLEI